MLKSQILEQLQKKHNNLSNEDIETLFDIFIKKISSSLKNGNNIEMRGFGTLSRKINKEKFVRNPKTNEIIYVPSRRKISFKPGKELSLKLKEEWNE